MKRRFANFLCKLLQWLNVSVVINFEIVGTLKGRTDQVFYYSNDFRNATVLDCNNDELVIPEGKFKMTIRILYPKLITT